MVVVVVEVMVVVMMVEVLVVLVMVILMVVATITWEPYPPYCCSRGSDTPPWPADENWVWIDVGVFGVGVGVT